MHLEDQGIEKPPETSTGPDALQGWPPPSLAGLRLLRL